ncbi:MAG: ABC transporter substrate-binding protein [Thermoplasmata archaeon]|nr:MAG: ABC transporter substrate-binding protein [Thermoplasmata archaeon]
MDRRWGIILALVMAFSVLAGCVGGGGGGTIEIPELTGNFEEDVINLGKFFESQGISTIKYTVWAAGDPNSIMRIYGVVEGAHRINKIFEDNNINVKITIEHYWEDSFSSLYSKFLSSVPQGTNGDFFVNSYVYIANLAEEGYILDITEYANKYSSVLDDFYAPLLEAAKYKGKYYGIPQDTEARPLYIRKDVAKAMGWDLTGLAEKVKNGEFTWYDDYQKAKEAVEGGYANWGVIHRKGSAHPDLMQFIFAFGGRLYDENTGKLVVDREALYKWFMVEYRMAQDGLIPKDMMSWDWGQQIHPTVVGEKDNPSNTLFYIGGTWQWTEWQTKAYYKDPQKGESRPLTPAEVQAKMYYTLFPAGEPGKSPVTLSQPFMWMIASNAGKDNDKYDELKEAYHKLAFLIIIAASDPEINAIHSVISGHVPVRREATALLNDENWTNKLINLELDLSSNVLDAIKDIIKSTADPINIKFLANVSYMLDYTHFAPSHPYYPKLADILKDAIDKVLRGAMTPEDAVNYVVQKVEADPDLKDNTEIIGEIPEGWHFP